MASSLFWREYFTCNNSGQSGHKWWLFSSWIRKTMSKPHESRSKLKPRPFRVSIEGNIGSGKSTCLNFFKRFETVEVHPEPIEKWRDVSGNNLLGLLYSDLDKWNFPFQHYVHLTRLQIQTSPPSSNLTQVKMFERSVQNNRYCFMENAKKNKFLKECEFQVLVAWNDWVEKHMDIGLDLIVYLRSTPEVVFHRMLKRGRCEESSVSLDYLKQIHTSYEEWLSTPEQVTCRVITIDADQEIEGVLQQLEHHTPFILHPSPSPSVLPVS